jgi:hypothetical protein
MKTNKKKTIVNAREEKAYNTYIVGGNVYY